MTMTKKHLIYLEDALAVMPALEMCTRALKTLRTVEAKPIVHSKWNYDGTCNNCKAQVLSNYTKYCPNCGAEMDT